MRLIDADELRRAMYHEAFEKDTDLQKWDSGCWIRYKMVENKIEEAPTIDVVEQKHGQWIDDSLYYCHCSICNHVVDGKMNYYNNDSFYNDNTYCRHCGAKMDEVTE